MSWELILVLFFACLLGLMLLGVPVAFAFLIVNLGFALFLPAVGLSPRQIMLSVPQMIMSFSLVPIALFVLMGEVLYHSGIATRTLDGLGKWLGPIPGRLSILSLGAGTSFAVLSGSAIANTALLSSLLIPEMRKRGYSKSMSAGPILAAGGLAMVIPPSAMAVLVGTIGNIPIGRLLIAGIVPGLLLAVLNTSYIVIRCWLNPDLAPRYEVEPAPWRERLIGLFRDVLPIMAIGVLVIWLIVGGLATPTEAAAVGGMASLLMMVLYGAFTLERLRKALLGTVRISGMIFLIMGGAAGYSQLLAFTGATRELLGMVTALAVAPILIVIIMQLVIVGLGAPLEQVSMLLIVMPVMVPVVESLGFSPVWFGLLVLINMDLANLTPPLGLTLYVVKGAAPEFSMRDVVQSAAPFMLVNIIVIGILLAFPELVLWLPDRLLG